MAHLELRAQLRRGALRLAARLLRLPQLRAALPELPPRSRRLGLAPLLPAVQRYHLGAQLALGPPPRRRLARAAVRLRERRLELCLLLVQPPRQPRLHCLARAQLRSERRGALGRLVAAVHRLDGLAQDGHLHSALLQRRARARRLLGARRRRRA